MKNGINKLRQLAFVLAIISIAGAGLYFYSNSRVPSYNIQEEVIIGPEAPQTNKFSTAILGGDNKNNTSKNPENLPEPLINQDEFQELGEIENIEYSQDYSLVLVISKSEKEVTSSSLIPKVKASENTTNKLSILDSTGNIISSFVAGRISNARFTDNNYITYQSDKPVPGVYKYDIKTQKQELIEQTYNNLALENIILIDDKNYFFIQSETGTIGFGTIGINEKKILDEKLLPSNSDYVKSSSYSFASLSPDKKLIALFDLYGDSAKAKLILLPVSANSIKDSYMEMELETNPRPIGKSEKIFTWSQDSKYLVLTTNGIIVDVANKTIKYTVTDSLLNSISLSEDSKKLSVVDFSNKNSYIVNLENNSRTPVANNVSQTKWISNQEIVLVIGKRLYNFDITDSLLERTLKEEDSYNIVLSNPVRGYLIVKQGEFLVQLNSLEY